MVVQQLIKMNQIFIKTFTNNVIVKVGNDVLRSGSQKIPVSTLREYEFKNWQVLPWYS